MKKIKLLLLLCVFSLSSMANYCEVSFLKSHHRQMYLKKENLNENILDGLFKKMQKTENLPDKLDLLEEQYDVIAKRFQSDLEASTKYLDELITKGEFPANKRESAIQNLKNGITKELSPHVDKLIIEAKSYFEKQGVEVFVKNRAFGREQDSFKYLELGGKSKSSDAARKLARYKERFKTKLVTFDLMENIQIGSGGFSMATTARIDLGVRGIRNLLVDDLITMVGKHEFHHAAFGAMRLKNQESIYHVSYYSSGKPLSNVKNGYNMFMSAEEVYNWANNSFWASTRIGNISKYAKKDFINDINGIYSYLPGTKRIAQQTIEITDNFMSKIDSIRSEIKSGATKFSPVFYTKDLKVARTSKEAVYFSVSLEDLGHDALEFISPRYKEYVDNIFKNRIQIEGKLTSNIDFNSLSDVKKRKLMQRFQKQESELNIKHYDELLEKFYISQKELHDVSEVLAMKSQLAVAETQSFVKTLNLEIKRNPKFLESKEAQEIFLEMRRIYRELGGVVKPGFKGYKQ